MRAKITCKGGSRKLNQKLRVHILLTSMWGHVGVLMLTHWGLVNFENLGQWLLKHLVIPTAAAELAAAVCITSHFNNHSHQHTRRHVGIWNDALDIRNPDLLSETFLNLPTPYGVTRPQWVNNESNLIQHYTWRCPSAFVAGTTAGIMLTIWDLQRVETDLTFSGLVQFPKNPLYLFLLPVPSHIWGRGNI